MKRQYLLLVLIGVSLALSVSRGANDYCTSNADCSNHGICSTVYGGQGCSCLPGFGGASTTCNNRPVSCAYSPVAPNITNFHPTVAFSIASSVLNLAITANLEQSPYANPSTDDTLTTATSYALDTSVHFGNGAATACDYPASRVSVPWTHNAAGASCVDNWQLSLPWASAISACGFSAPAQSHTWSQVVTVSRRYQLPTLGDGVPITRTESITKTLSVVFPTSVVVQNDVNVTGPVAVSVNAITSSFYDVPTDTWTIIIKTLTKRPYKLTAPTVSSVSGEISVHNRYKANSASIAATSACNSNDLPCAQTITLNFVGCAALSGGVTVTTVPVCSGAEGNTCPHIDGTIAIGLSINNADSCAIVNNIDFSTKALYSFSDSALTQPKTLFAASDIAYFGAVIQSTNATLTGFTLTSACLSLDGGNCQSVVTTGMTATGGMNPVFAINLAQTRFLTTDTNRRTFTVKATVSVTWANGKRDVQIARANIDSEVSVDLSQLPTSEDEDDLYAAGSSVMQASFVVAFVMLVLSLL